VHEFYILYRRIYRRILLLFVYHIVRIRLTFSLSLCEYNRLCGCRRSMSSLLRKFTFLLLSFYIFQTFIKNQTRKKQIIDIFFYNSNNNNN